MKSKNKASNPVNSSKNTRKAYSKPHLKLHGKVRNLTFGIGSQYYDEDETPLL